jgi:hypothetical protein
MTRSRSSGMRLPHPSGSGYVARARCFQRTAPQSRCSRTANGGAHHLPVGSPIRSELAIEAPVDEESEALIAEPFQAVGLICRLRAERGAGESEARQSFHVPDSIAVGRY